MSQEILSLDDSDNVAHVGTKNTTEKAASPIAPLSRQNVSPYSEPPKPFYLLNGTNLDPTSQVSLVKALGVLKSSPAFKDVLIVSNDGGQFYAHSLILRASSPELARLIDENKEFSQNQLCKIELEDCNASVVRSMLDCIYEDSADIDPSDISQLISAAKKYCIPILRTACMVYLTQCISKDNAIKLYRNLYSSVTHLEFLLSFIRTNATSIFESKDFERLDEEKLIALLQDDDLLIAEAHVFRAIRRWGVAECARRGLSPATQESLSSVLKNVLPNVRFHHMSAQDIATSVSASRLLPPHQLLQLYTYIAQSQVDPSALPPIFSAPPRLGSSPLTWGFSPRFCGQSTIVRNSDPTFAGYNEAMFGAGNHVLGSMPLRTLACWRVTPPPSSSGICVGVSTNTRFPDDSMNSPGVYLFSSENCRVNGEKVDLNVGGSRSMKFDATEGVDVCFWPQRGLLFAITKIDEQILTMNVPIGPEYVAHTVLTTVGVVTIKPIPLEKAFGNLALTRLIYQLHKSGPGQ